MQRTFISDRDGVIELPFKLLIASIIVIVTASMAYAGLESYSKVSAEASAEAAAKAVIAGAADVSSLGINSSVKANLDIKGGPFHRVESFVIGCGPNETTYKCKGVEYKVSGEKAVWLVAKDQAGHDIVLKGKGGKVALGEGTHEVLLMKRSDHIEVSKLS
jgi:uncharacterized protein (UPF0333 family)